MANGKVVIETQLDTTDFDKGLNNMEKSGQQWSTAMKASILAVSVAVVGLGTSFVNAGLKFNTAVENYETSFEVMLGSQEAATEKMQELIDIGASTPFEVTQLADATQTLLAFGVSADESSKYLVQLGDISQGNTQKFDSLTLAFGKMNSSQKVTLEYLNIMIEQGFNPLNIIADKTGETMADLYDRVSAGGVSFEEITEAITTATSQGGQFFQSMEKQSKTLTGVTSTLSDEFNNFAGKVTEPLFEFIRDVAVPAMGDLIAWMNKKIETTDWQQVGRILDDIIGYIKLAVAGFIALKAAMLIDKAIKAFQTAQLTIALFSATTNKAGLSMALWNGTLTASEVLVGILTGKISLLSVAQAGLTTAFQTFNKVIAANPILAVTGVVLGLATAIKLVSDAMNKEMIQATENMADGMQEFLNGVSSAESKLNNFSGVFEDFNEESEEITQGIKEVQDGITQITDLATAERRALTDSEIQKLDEYFDKLNNLQDAELQVQEAKAKAVQDQALIIAQTQYETLAEYQTYAEEWIATAQEQSNETLGIIEEQTVNEIALLNQRYGEEAVLTNEAYKAEIDAIMEKKNEKIANAHDEQAQIYSAFADGYAKQLGLNEIFQGEYAKLEEARIALEEDWQKTHDEIHANEYLSATQKNEAILRAHDLYTIGLNSVKDKQYDIWKEATEGMSQQEQEQVGVWLALIAGAETYGAELTDETYNTANGIISNFDRMPKEARDAMYEVVNGMAVELDDKAPSLYNKASGIANGILSTLQKAFDIHSPSKKTREIAKYVMQGMEAGIEDEESTLQKQVDNLTDDISSSFEDMQKAVNLETSKMSANVQTGKTYNSIMNTIPVSVNNKNETVLKVDRRVLAEVTNETNEDMNLQYGY